MLHSEILQLLLPVALGGTAAADLELEGRQLDQAQTAADRLPLEMFADTCDTALVDWERVLGIAPALDAKRAERINEVLFRLRSLGRLDRQYFIDIAATVGYEITITEYQPLMAGWAEAEVHEVLVENLWWIWGVTIAGGFAQYARASQAAAGEPLEWYRDKRHLDDIFNDLKPAHTQVVFI